MQQIVISPGHGGFSITDEMVNRLRALGHIRSLEITTAKDLKEIIPDDDPLLIKVIKRRVEQNNEQPGWEEVVDWLRLEGHPTIMQLPDIFDLQNEIARDDPLLVQVVSELIEETKEVPLWDQYAGLAIIEIPDGAEWQIEEYDGAEWVAEKHRTWQYEEPKGMYSQLLNKRAGKEHLNKAFE